MKRKNKTTSSYKECNQKRIKKEPDWLIYFIILYIAIFGTLSLIYFIRW